MTLDKVQFYFKTNVEALERELTNISLQSDDFGMDCKVLELKQHKKR